MDRLVMFAKVKLACGKYSRLSPNMLVDCGLLEIAAFTTLLMLPISLRQQRPSRSSITIHVHIFFASKISTIVRDLFQRFYPVLPLLVDAGYAKSNSPPLNSQKMAPDSR
jgi:hypothetical protein